MALTDHLLRDDIQCPAFFVAVDAAGDAERQAVLRLADHERPEVRRAVASTIPLLAHGDSPTDAMVAVLIGLSGDPDPRVRDWACCGLAEFREVDTDALRDALAARLDDIDRDTRTEALVGLAYRQDPRAMPRVRAALARRSGDVWRLEMVAAGALSDPTLHELVLRHQHGWDDPQGASVAEAALRLTDPNGPGSDLVEGVAELIRRRSQGHSDGDADASWALMDEMLDIAPFRAPEMYNLVRQRLNGDEAAIRHLENQTSLAQLAAEATA